MADGRVDAVKRAVEAVLPPGLVVEEPRLRKETTTMVEELLTGWREMAGRGIER